MATIRRFEDLKAWQKARKFAHSVFKLYQHEPFSKDYKLVNQINGSSGSVMDNIAEGFDRNGSKEFIQFLTIATASLSESKSQLYRALDREYITVQVFEEIQSDASELGKIIGGLVKYLQNTDYKGTKFKVEEDEIKYSSGKKSENTSEQL